LDANGFVDIYINHPVPPGESLFEVRNTHEYPVPYLEWIVRGVPDRRDALALAENIIAEKKNGAIITHDVEGRVGVIRLPKQIIDWIKENAPRS
jgi:hypothetical protein